MEQRDGGVAGGVAKAVDTAPSSELGDTGRFRKLKPPFLRELQRLMLWGIPFFALIFNFDLPARLGFPLLQEQYLGIILILVLGTIFLSVPASARPTAAGPAWYDLLFFLLSVAIGVYLVVFYPRIVNEIGELTTDKVAFGAIAIILVMEASRRVTGWVLVMIAAAFILYAHYSYLFPGIL
jgi:TRAP-type uncharacterized transport system fused permease subunit